MIDPEALKNGSADLATLAFGVTFDAEITLLHELGHAFADMIEADKFVNIWSVEFENQGRERRNEGRFRVSEFATKKDPASMRPRK